MISPLERGEDLDLTPHDEDVRTAGLPTKRVGPQSPNHGDHSALVGRRIPHGRVEEVTRQAGISIRELLAAAPK